MSDPSPPSGLDEQLVKKLARLAKLALDDAEVAALVPELRGIVRHVDTLRGVSTSGVPPTLHGAPLGSEDAVAAAGPTEAGPILGRAAVEHSAGYDAEDGTVIVPKVLD